MPKKRLTAVVTLLSTSAAVLPSSEANSPPAGSVGTVPPVPVVPPRPAVPVVPPRPAVPAPVVPAELVAPPAPGPVSPPEPVIPPVPLPSRSVAFQHAGMAMAAVAQTASDASVRGQKSFIREAAPGGVGRAARKSKNIRPALYPARQKTCAAATIWRRVSHPAQQMAVHDRPMVPLDALGFTPRMAGRAIIAGVIAGGLVGVPPANAAPADPAERAEALLLGSAINRFAAKQLPTTFTVRGDRAAGIGAEDVTLVDARYCGAKDTSRG